MERLYRDAPLMMIGEGANEMQLIIIARQLVARNPVPHDPVQQQPVPEHRRQRDDCREPPRDPTQSERTEPEGNVQGFAEVLA
mgnify:CR=1 FL=1